MERPMKRNDLSRSLVAFEQNSTLVAVVELSLKSWLVGGLVPGLTREPLKRLGADENALLKLLHRWQDEAIKAGREIKRIVLAFEAGRDGFWLARWLRARGIEAYVIHPNSVPVAREHRRAKSDRLDTSLLKRAFLGWLRGEAKHCGMAAIPTLTEEDARRSSREHEHLVGERTRLVSRMKAVIVRLGVRGFNVKLRKASEQLEQLRAAEHAGRAAARHGAAGARSRADQRDREAAAAAPAPGAAAGHASHDAVADEDPGDRAGDGGHAGSRGVVAPAAR
jgi:transposase